MKKLIMGLLCISLNGCMWQSINSSDLIVAQAYCKDRMGIAEITASFIGREEVTCINGDSIATYNIILTTNGLTVKN